MERWISQPYTETCFDWLKPSGIFSVEHRRYSCRIEQIPAFRKDSVDILESLGMIYECKLKSAMEGYAGTKQTCEDGKPNCKNFCKIGDKYLKYEPVYVFRKERP